MGEDLSWEMFWGPLPCRQRILEWIGSSKLRAETMHSKQLHPPPYHPTEAAYFKSLAETIKMVCATHRLRLLNGKHIKKVSVQPCGSLEPLETQGEDNGRNWATMGEFRLQANRVPCTYKIYSVHNKGRPQRSQRVTLYTCAKWTLLGHFSFCGVLPVPKGPSHKNSN